MILTLEHFPLVEALIRSVHHHTEGHYDLDRGLYWIKNSYLSQVNGQYLFGSFDGDELISICGLRTYFPDKDSACISNVFYQVKSMKLKQKVLASEEAYKYAFDLGLKKVFSTMKTHQYKSQWDLVTRYSPFIDSLTIKEIEIIKANHESPHDWVNSMLGRTKHSVDYSVREASL
jgi:hypothetical protein